MNVLLLFVVLVLEPEPLSVAVTGQMVVYKDMTSVVTLPSFAGQLVTVGAHEVIVYTFVVYTVEVV